MTIGSFLGINLTSLVSIRISDEQRTPIGQSKNFDASTSNKNELAHENNFVLLTLYIDIIFFNNHKLIKENMQDKSKM